MLYQRPRYGKSSLKLEMKLGTLNSILFSRVHNLSMDLEKLDEIFQSSSSMFSHRLSERRMKLVFLTFLALLFFCTLLAINRHDHIKEYVKGHGPSQLAHKSSKDGSRGPSGSLRKLTDQTLGQLNNRTLGVCILGVFQVKRFANRLQFEKVFTINLPSRSDKLDAIRVAADLTGFDLDVIEGVNGDLVPDKALPGVCSISPRLVLANIFLALEGRTAQRRIGRMLESSHGLCPHVSSQKIRL